MFPVKDVQKAVAEVYVLYKEATGINMPILVAMALGKLDCKPEQYAKGSAQITTYIRDNNDYVIVSGVGGGVFQKKHARNALKGEARAIQSRMDNLVEEMEQLSARAKTVKRGFAKLEKA